MKGASFTSGKTWVLRVDPGEDVLEAIEKFIRENNISQGYVAAGYGTLTDASLHWVRHNRLPTDNLFAEVEGGIEILAMNGLIAEGTPHIHVSLSMPTGAFGGHLEPGTKAYVLCEI
ncbi:MAG: PPC domain-containing DNA-binding protein, partial [Planctomycetota bacterium]